MKMVKNLVNNTVSAIRAKKFLVRTAIMLALSFLALLGISIAFDMVYQALARHSLAYVAAGLVLGQVYLYKNDLGRLKAFLSNAASDQTPVGRQRESSRESGSPAAAGSAVSMSEGLGTAFANEDDDDYDDSMEDFEDDDEI